MNCILFWKMTLFVFSAIVLHILNKNVDLLYKVRARVALASAPWSCDRIEKLNNKYVCQMQICLTYCGVKIIPARVRSAYKLHWFSEVAAFSLTSLRLWPAVLVI
jgi:late competence protein required for DNA uptake (superfamily II DNA/RNA helicase)